MYINMHSDSITQITGRKAMDTFKYQNTQNVISSFFLRIRTLITTLDQCHLKEYHQSYDIWSLLANPVFTVHY